MRNVRAITVLIIMEFVALAVLCIVIGVSKLVPFAEESGPIYIPRETRARMLPEDTEIERPVDLTGTEYAGQEGTLSGNTAMSEEAGLMYGMNTRQKAAQLLMASPEALTGGETVTEADIGLREAVAEFPLAGFVLTDSNFPQVPQSYSLIEDIDECIMDSTGMQPFLMYEGAGLSVEEASERGFNLYEVPNGDVNTGELLAEAALNGMLPVYTGSLSSFSNKEEFDGAFIVAQVSDAREIAQAIRDGGRFIYRPDDPLKAYEDLAVIIEEGGITGEELDNAVSYVVSLKAVIADMKGGELFPGQ